MLTRPTLFLAPMEGVTDAPMRALLTSLGGFDFSVTEFIRVSQEIQGAHVFIKHIPELAAQSRTPSGTPVLVQLLGGDPERVAQSALNAVAAGAHGIDLNFGCPAPTVNRHDGGASLLRDPARLEAIVRAVRQAVPREISVSAKLRLGWDDMNEIHRNADRVQAAGASWLTIHARTKVQGYQPPVYWEPIALVRKRLSIPVVANGDVWTLEDWRRCRDVTECEHYMLGRGALVDPYLALKIRAELDGSKHSQKELRAPSDWLPLFKSYAQGCDPVGANPNYPLRRIKQWAGVVARSGEREWISVVKRASTLSEALMSLEAADRAYVPQKVT